MKKKAIKIAASTAVAASAFVAAAPANQADAATNVNQLATDAQNAGTVLKWAISVEGSANYVTRPYDQYNAAKKAIAAAEAAAAKLSTSEKLTVDAKLVEPKLQVKRAQAYIDAITSSEKIKELTANLDAAIKTDDIEKVETAYHKATAEYRKQAALLDRVYGQSTRDGIRNEVKPAIEKLVASVKNEVTVNMLAKSADANIKAGKLAEAGQNVSDAQAILDANVLKWETSLQKSVDDVATALPLTVLSVSRVNDTTVVVNLNKKSDVALAESDFSFDKGLVVTQAVLSADKKSVTLTTTAQTAGVKYTAYFQGVSTGKQIEKPLVDNGLITETDALYAELGTTRSYTVTVKDANNKPYTGTVSIELFQDDEDTALAAGNASYISSINGSSYPAATGNGSTVTATVTNGNLSFIVTGDTTALTGAQTTSVVPKIVRSSDDEELYAGETVFYELAPTDNYTISSFSSSNDVIDKDKKFIIATTTAGTYRFNVDANDDFYIESTKSTLDKFFSALGSKDLVSLNYNEKAANKSVFTIVSDENPASNLSVDKFGGTTAYTIDSNSLQLSGKAQAGSKIYVFTDNGLNAGEFDYGNALATENDQLVVGPVTTDGNGVWRANVATLTQNATNKFVVVQVNPNGSLLALNGSDDDSEYVEVTSDINVGKFAAETVELTEKVGAGTLNIGDELTFTFLNDAVAPSTFNHLIKKTTTGKVVVSDVFGKTATLTVKATGDDKVLTITSINAQTGFVFDSANGFEIQSTTGVLNQDGLTFSVKDSKDKVVD